MRNIDLLLYNGNIIDLEEKHRLYNWVAVKDGKIYSRYRIR